MKQLRNFIYTHKVDLIVFVLLLIAGVAHGYNMFHYPYYENDEGTYMSQAWALTQGKLAPYTYWYDHAPGGWIFIYLWTVLTGGFFTFGASVNSGRVLMLLLHIVMSAFLLYLGKKMTKSLVPGTIAVLIFSLSPLAVYFQRRVLLDNMMIFWVLLALVVLYRERLKLRHIIVSAIAFGIAVLVKENAIFFLPAFLYVIFQRTKKNVRSFALVKWISITGMVISLYFLYALLNGEFFPTGAWLGGEHQHVSMLQSLKEQSSRGGLYPIWDARSEFSSSLADWLRRDAYFIYSSLVFLFISIIMSIRVKYLRPLVLFCLLFLAFLLRGKFILNFYILPIIPFMSLLMGIVTYVILKFLSFHKTYMYRTFVGIIVVSISLFLLSRSSERFTKNENYPQIKTIEWIKHNLSPDAHIVMDDSIYVDLHAQKDPEDKIFPNAEWSSKVDKDPEVSVKKYQNDWKKLEYIALSHEIVKQMDKDAQTSLVKKAFDNATLVTEWKDNSTAYIDLDKYVSTNGDWMAMYKVGDRDEILLNASWRYFKSKFLQSYGQVVEPQNENRTTTQGQATAMLKAVWHSDRDTFDGVYAWTKDHLQYRTNDALFSSVWGKRGDTEMVLDSESASDGDQDIALALLFAYKRWGDEKYLTEAKRIINDIWRKEVVLINGHYYLISGTGAQKNGGYLVNPSYYSPAAYRIFAQVDTLHPWNTLATDTYFFLNRLGQEGNATYLPKNWIYLTKGGAIQSAAGYKKDADYYGHEGFKTLWRVGLDRQWYNSPQARSYLEKTAPFFEEEWNSNKKIAAVYDTAGDSIGDDSSLSINIGALTALGTTDKKAASELYKKQYDDTFHFDDGYWKDGKNYEEQNWAWFGTGLYNKRLTNLWETRATNQSQ